MTETSEGYNDILADDLAGLRDAIEIHDWPGALEIALEIENRAPEEGWSIVGDLARNLSTTLGADNADVVPADVIEVLADVMALCVSREYRNLEDLDSELVSALKSLKSKYLF